MTNFNIIGFGGRLQSGKSTLAQICEEFGYQRLYFALPLKQLCADILDVSIDELNQLKINNTNINLQINEDICDIIAVETEIPLYIVLTLGNNKLIKNVRELLQFVGTDIIRKYNTNWHVNRIREMIKPNEKYVLDDVRFPNEKELIEELDGTLWYVVRPNLTNVSNHASETSIKWQDVDNLIINDKSLSYLEMCWRMFMEYGYQNAYEKRATVMEHILGNINSIEVIDDTTFSLIDHLCISKWEFMYENINFDSIPNIEIHSDKNNMNYLSIIDTHENNVSKLNYIKNPLNIEDYKFKMFDN